MGEWYALTAVWGFPLSNEQVAQFEIYLRLLLEWNSQINLTAVREPEAIRERHFLDALSCAQVIRNGDMALIDIGTGAGFPGLPLKILYPPMRLTLVESVAKKTRFLEAVVTELGLKDVAILAERAEALGQDKAHRQQYDWATARAVAEIRVLAEYLLPLCKVGGHMLAQKGVSGYEEAALAKSAIAQLGGGKPVFQVVQLPSKTEEHVLVVVPKTAVTPATYPRPIGVPGKRPLI